MRPEEDAESATDSGSDEHGYTLEELIAGITDENRHAEVDWGPAVGAEVWWCDEEDA